LAGVVIAFSPRSLVFVAVLLAFGAACRDADTSRAARGDRVSPGGRQEVSAPRVCAERPFEVIGHRGDSARVPENTLASIQAAFDAGATMVEVDVMLTRDGVPVLMHDFTLERTTDGRGRVDQLTLSELKRLDAGSWFGVEFAGERIPTFEEALRSARRRGRLLIDPKVDGMGRALARALTNVGVGPDILVLGTWERSQFDDFLLHLPEAEIFWSGDEPPDWRRPGYFEDQQRRGVDGFEIGPPPSAAFVRAAHAACMPVYVFTVNASDSLATLLDIGIDGIETDVPGTLHALVVEKRGSVGTERVAEH
jgi:glycerophosphoryl diester phosphodiesterase